MQLTTDVEDCVDAGNWAEAAALDVQRCEQVGAYLNQVGDGPGRAAVLHMLQELLARNELAMRKVQVMRELITEKTSELRSAETAMRAYVSHTAAGLTRFG